MKSRLFLIISAALGSLTLSGCLSNSTSSSATAGQNTVLVSEIVTICGAVVGDQAQERINQEWAKHPEAEANRPLIEAVTESLLNDPTATEEQRSKQYKKYLTCATGLLMSNGIVK